LRRNADGLGAEISWTYSRTIAHAICDRLVHNAHVVKLGEPSIAEKQSPRTDP
jgi:hypothetical protein